MLSGQRGGSCHVAIPAAVSTVHLLASPPHQPADTHVLIIRIGFVTHSLTLLTMATSLVWKYFTISAIDSTRVSCNICNTSLSRGGKGAASYNTSNLRKHLESKHDDEYRELRRLEDEKKTPAAPAAAGACTSTSTGRALTQQPSIVRAFDNRRLWEFDGQRSRRIHRVIGEMIALDDQPFNVVNNR